MPVGAVTATEPVNEPVQPVFTVGLLKEILGKAGELPTVALAVFVQAFAPVTVTV